MKARKQKQLIIIAVLLIVFGMGIAYAAIMSTTLNISASSIATNQLSWNVGFTGSSASATTGGTSATGRSCGSATITASTVTLADTTLSKPNDSCRYTLTIKNNGTIPATIASINPTAPSGITCNPISGAKMVCGNITYIIATNTAGTTALTTGGTALAAGASRTVYLMVKYTGSSLNSSTVTHTGAQFTIVYNQA